MVDIVDLLTIIMIFEIIFLLFIYFICFYFQHGGSKVTLVIQRMIELIKKKNNNNLKEQKEKEERESFILYCPFSCFLGGSTTSLLALFLIEREGETQHKTHRNNGKHQNFHFQTQTQPSSTLCLYSLPHSPPFAHSLLKTLASLLPLPFPQFLQSSIVIGLRPPQDSGLAAAPMKFLCFLILGQGFFDAISPLTTPSLVRFRRLAFLSNFFISRSSSFLIQLCV